MRSSPQGRNAGQLALRIPSSEIAHRLRIPRKYHFCMKYCTFNQKAKKPTIPNSMLTTQNNARSARIRAVVAAAVCWFRA